MISKSLHTPRASPGSSFYPSLIFGGLGRIGPQKRVAGWHFRFFHDNNSHLWKTLIFAWQDYIIKDFFRAIFAHYGETRWRCKNVLKSFYDAVTGEESSWLFCHWLPSEDLAMFIPRPRAYNFFPVPTLSSYSAELTCWQQATCYYSPSPLISS